MEWSENIGIIERREKEREINHSIQRMKNIDQLDLSMSMTYCLW